MIRKQSEVKIAARVPEAFRARGVEPRVRWLINEKLVEDRLDQPP
jgi:hypothetical protein